MGFEGILGCAGVAKAARAEGDVEFVGGLLNVACVDAGGSRGEDIESNSTAAVLHGARAVYGDHGGAVGVLEGEHVAEEDGSEGMDPGVNVVNANACNKVNAKGDGRDGEKVDGALLEGGLVRGEGVAIVPDAGILDGASGKPGALQHGEGLFLGDEGADAGGQAEDLVEGDGDKVGADDGEVEVGGGDEGGGIEQDEPAVPVRGADGGEVVLDAREVGLGGEGEEVVRVGVALVQVRREGRAAHGGGERDVRGGGGGVARVHAHAVDGVVVVGEQEQGGAGGEREGLRDELDGGRGVRREDQAVLGRVGAEVAQDRAPRSVDLRRRDGRGRVGRVRVAEAVVVQKGLVVVQDGQRVQARSRVV